MQVMLTETSTNKGKGFHRTVVLDLFEERDERKRIRICNVKSKIVRGLVEDEFHNDISYTVHGGHVNQGGP